MRYSDLPVTLIAEQVGYQDVSAFSRRFREVSGHPPTWCRK
ncbi:helix-turn-helix domain-containing protein [Vibrio proteolyticus]